MTRVRAARLQSESPPTARLGAGAPTNNRKKVGRPQDLGARSGIWGADRELQGLPDEAINVPGGSTDVGHSPGGSMPS